MLEEKHRMKTTNLKQEISVLKAKPVLEKREKRKDNYEPAKDN